MTGITNASNNPLSGFFDIIQGLNADADGFEDLPQDVQDLVNGLNDEDVTIPPVAAPAPVPVPAPAPAASPGITIEDISSIIEGLFSSGNPGVNNPTSNIPNNVTNSDFNINNIRDIFEAINSNILEAANLGQLSALASAISSVNLAELNFNNTLAQIELQELAAEAQNQANLQSMALRETQLLSLTAIENQALIDQYREKLLNMRAEVLSAKINNSWTRIKNIASAFKY